MSTDYKSKWDQCLQFIRESLNNDTRFETWFANTKAIGMVDNKLELQLPSHYCFELYEDTFFPIIYSALTKVFGKDIKLKYSVAVLANDAGGTMKIERPLSSDKNNTSEKSDVPDKNDTYFDNKTKTITSDNGFNSFLNPLQTFENFCVADSNRLPHSIAESIAAKPKNSNFNPFFLYGDVGVGKTHLMQAIGLRIKENYPNAKVLFIPMKEFQRRYAYATMSKKIPDFINWFMSLDVLLFDDLQELAHKTKTLNDALFPIFNYLHQNGKQLVFTCDRPPMELEGIADRLIDRFKWGITEKLEKPDAALRKKILQFKATRNGIELPDEIIEMIAGSQVNSVREIEGIVLGILTRSIALNKPIDVNLAMDVLRNSIKVPKKRTINFDMIVEATADYFSLNPDVIFSKSKVRDVADARMMIMYLAHKLLNLSSVAIGHKLKRKHTTVLHGINAISDRIPVTPVLSEAVMAIEASLK